MKTTPTLHSLTFDLFNDLSSHTSLGHILQYQLHITQIAKVRPALDHVHPIILLSPERLGADHVPVPCCHAFGDEVQVVMATQQKVDTVLHRIR